MVSFIHKFMFRALNAQAATFLRRMPICVIAMSHNVWWHYRNTIPCHKWHQTTKWMPLRSKICDFFLERNFLSLYIGCHCCADTRCHSIIGGENHRSHNINSLMHIKKPSSSGLFTDTIAANGIFFSTDLCFSHRLFSCTFTSFSRSCEASIECSSVIDETKKKN